MVIDGVIMKGLAKVIRAIVPGLHDVFGFVLYSHNGDCSGDG